MTVRVVASFLWLLLTVNPTIARDRDQEKSPVLVMDTGVTSPGVEKRVDPVYPEQVKEKLAREVWLEGVVEADGTLTGLKVYHGINADFDQRALDAAAKWRFTPGTRTNSNQPVRVHVQLILEFKPPAPPAPESADPFGRGAHKVGEPGLTLPVPTHRVDPQYPKEAMKQKIQGEVSIEAIVQADGKVGDVRVVKSLDTKYGVDESAIAAVKRWEFQPGRFNGDAVPVVLNITLEFRLR